MRSLRKKLTRSPKSSSLFFLSIILQSLTRTQGFWSIEGLEDYLKRNCYTYYMSDVDDIVPTEAEKFLKRKRPPAEPTQSPPPPSQLDHEDPADEDDLDSGEVLLPVEPDDVPDLGAYFSLFDIDDEAVISMCRAYASYLASLSKKKIYRRLHPLEPEKKKVNRRLDFGDGEYP